MNQVLGLSVIPYPVVMTEEQQLIQLAQQGDSEAFARLYDAHIDRIYRYVYYRVTDDQIAEDITSRVFMKMWEKLPQYRVGNSSIIAWLYRIAHNAIVDYYRCAKITIPLEQVDSRECRQECEVEEHLDLQARIDQVRAALQELTEGQREVLIMKFIEGLSVREIARQLGKRQGAVRGLQMRGLHQLAKSTRLQGDPARAPRTARAEQSAA